jgi:protein gp37
MSENTSIEWCDNSWNPIRARSANGRKGHFCEKISAGCKNCYASRMQSRFGMFPYLAENRSKVELFLDEKVLLKPLSWKGRSLYEPGSEKAVGYQHGLRIFVCSMTDLFHEGHSDEWLDRIFAVMALCPQHIFQVLTKRPQRMADYVEGRSETGCGMRGALVRWPLPNVHLGVSCENQAAADERIPLLLQTPAAVRFISAEPVLGPINLEWLGHDGDGVIDALHGEDWTEEWLSDDGSERCRTIVNWRAKLDWVIIGGESGPSARPCDLAWIRHIVEQCKAAGTACFVKQLGAHPYGEWGPYSDYAGRTQDDVRPKHKKGGDISEFPADLRIREFPKEVVPA